MQKHLNTLQLSREGSMWVVRDRNNPTWLDLFDTDVLPTPFGASTKQSIVLASIRRLNPNRLVEVKLL